jgi:hypothetical protein
MISRLTQGLARHRQTAPDPVLVRVAAVALTLLALMLVSAVFVPHAEAAPASVTSNGTYVVRPGDTLNSIAARYGVSPSVGSLATRLKITVKTTMVSRGLTTAQATPMTVCLYRTEMSRQARMRKSSR